MKFLLFWRFKVVLMLAFLFQQGAATTSQTNDERLSHINIKFQSTQNITFLYDQAFRIKYAESSFKEYHIPPFCSLTQPHFSAVEAQKFDLSDYCLDNCLVNYNSKQIYIVNSQSQLLVFAMEERQINYDFRIHTYLLVLKSKLTLSENLQTEKLKKSRLLVNNQNYQFPEAVLMMSEQLIFYFYGRISQVSFDVSDASESSFKAISLYKQYLIVPNDSTGIQIYKFSLSNLNTGILLPHLSIAISQFFSEQEWQEIQESLSLENDDVSEFQFNFSIESLQIQDQANSTSLFFVSESYSKSICIFQVDLESMTAKLNSKISMNGKIPNIVSQNNYLYAHQTNSKGLREANQLVELQSKNTQPLSYLPRQTYPLTSSIQKVVLSKSLVFSLQENIISIVRRQIPFKLTSDDDARSQISILYSEGADDLWQFPVAFQPISLGKDKKMATSDNNESSFPGGLQSDLIKPTDPNYFSPNITLLETNTISFVDAILVKKDQSLSLLIIQERLPYLNCFSENEEELKQPYQALVNIEVFSSIDASGNEQFNTYQEAISLSVYKEIFENSTVALVVGLGIGLTLSLVVVIVFCIYFFRMKNRYQLLIDQTKDTEFVVSTSISSGSDSNSSDSYPPATVVVSHQREELPNTNQRKNEQEKKFEVFSQLNHERQQQIQQLQVESHLQHNCNDQDLERQKQQQSLNDRIIVESDSYDLPNPAQSPHEKSQNEEEEQQ